jgi:hypothetical protein
MVVVDPLLIVRRTLREGFANPKLYTVLVNLTVSDGNVRLWGVVENADEAAAAETAAKIGNDLLLDFRARCFDRPRDGMRGNLASLCGRSND